MRRRFIREDIKKAEPPDFSKNLSQGLVTRDGHSAKIIAVLKKVPFPLVVEVAGRMENYTLDGKYNQVYQTNMDLFINTL